MKIYPSSVLEKHAYKHHYAQVKVNNADISIVHADGDVGKGSANGRVYIYGYKHAVVLSVGMSGGEYLENTKEVGGEGLVPQFMNGFLP